MEKTENNVRPLPQERECDGNACDGLIYLCRVHSFWSRFLEHSFLRSAPVYNQRGECFPSPGGEGRGEGGPNLLIV